MILCKYYYGSIFEIHMLIKVSGHTQNAYINSAGKFNLTHKNKQVINTNTNKYP